MSTPKNTGKSFIEAMIKLAAKTGLDFDGHGDDRLFYSEEHINVWATGMSKEDYKEMEKLLRKREIKRKHYTVYVWNDVSSYEYWKERGETGDCNYIQVTVHAKNPSKIKPGQLKRDVERLFNEFCHYSNFDEYYRNREVSND